MAILEIDNLTLDIGDARVLDSLTLDIWEGYIHALIGPNGAGKSTLAYTVMGLSGYTDFQGEIRFDGRSLEGVSVDERARLGLTLAWQEPARYEGLAVRKFIRAGAKDKSEDGLAALLNKVGLEPRRYLERAVDRTLSGGERKRIELASILAMEPRLVLMDEPDSGIDVEALEHIFEALRTLKENGATVILITHSMAVLEHAEHAFLMCCGRLIDKGSVEKIGGYVANKCIPCSHKNEPEMNEVAT